MSSPDEVARDLRALALAARAGSHRVVVTHTARLQTDVRRRASEPRTNPRPRGAEFEGPRALSGDYRLGIGRRTTRTAVESVGTVGTNDRRGRALELGNPHAFGGTRRTLAYPHFVPALDAIQGEFVRAMAAIGVPVGSGLPAITAGTASSVGGAP